MKDGKFESREEEAIWREFYAALLQGPVIFAAPNAEMADEAPREFTSRLDREEGT